MPSVMFLNNGLYPCKTGGIEIFHYYFTKALSAYYPAIVLSQCGKPFSEPEVSVHDISSPFGRLQTLFTAYHHCRQLIRNRKQVGLIHIPYSSGHLFQYYHAMLVARRFGIPYILRISSGHMLPARPDFLHEIYFRNAAALIGVSPSICEEYERRYGYPVRHIPSYLPFLESKKNRDELREQHGIDTSALVLLCVGSVKPLKGTGVLVDALRELGRDYLVEKKLVTLVVGGGELVEKLKDSAEQAGIQEYVRFTGSVPYEKVHEYYSLADVFCIPSFAEARPLSLAEAIYNGLPAIGSNIPAIAQSIEPGKNGLLVPPRDVSALAKAVRTLIEDPSLRRRFALGSQAERTKYNKFDDMVSEYADLYRDLMARRTANEAT